MSAASDVDAFISRWGDSGGGERSNYQMFLRELCVLLDVPEPEPATEDESRNAYVFERRVTVRRVDGAPTSGFIDLYKRHCFVLEAKQSAKRQKFAEARNLSLELPERRVGSGRRGGAQWDALLRNAREQAENYARRLPVEEGWPPFLVVVDVGHVIELYADFSLQGKHYAQFPDRQSYRIYLDDLRDEEVRERLRQVWTDPSALDPAKRSAKVTREVAELLARLSQSLEARLLKAVEESDEPDVTASHRRAAAEKVAMFLMRCLFTMFAEDIGLIKQGIFTGFLKEFRGKADRLHLALEALWREMNKGGFSTQLREDLLRFNGGLFRDATAVQVDEDELNLLIIAAERKWQDVEPAIFGTLLERALDPRERHSLGAHYTPRAYVERLVVATIIEPLTEDWRDVEAAAAKLVEDDKPDEARDLVRAFHRHLCEIRVLDPACGTGNFLYVSLELLKRLEGVVLDALLALGETQENLELDRHTVDPHQFLGLEINPRAVAIAELVLWIGYLQWHFRTRGRSMPAQPVLRNFHNIAEQDAILAYDSWDVLRDERGRPITRWDGVTFKLHPITGEEVPDEGARRELRTYLNPRPATWPEAEFIVGNPPFIGGKDMRQELDDGYAEACWKARPYIPGGADFVMHFWDKAADTVRRGKARRFGLITTNSITQTFSRRVVERHLADKRPLSLVMAIPDHPWMKSPDKAAVRIAMTVGVAGDRTGVLQRTTVEHGLDTDAPTVELSSRSGKIWSNLTIGPDTGAAVALRSNLGLSSPGVKLHGSGFIVKPTEARALGLGSVDGLDDYIVPYRNGRDLTSRPRGVMVIDLYPLDEKDVRERFRSVYQWLQDRVKPPREGLRGNSKDADEYADRWWQFGKPRSELRKALLNLDRYIATVETSKHRFFQFLDASVRPDNMLIAIALDDAFHMGVLSSHHHVQWALALGGTLEDRPRYNKSRCFDTFPFPVTAASQRDEIGRLAEALDAHRKEVLAQHKQLTMTKLYNVLEKARTGPPLSEAERDVYDAGLVGVMLEIHNDLDRCVAEAYGWPADLTDEDILNRLVALNRERAVEERDGKVRWLRPSFQAPTQAAGRQAGKQLEADLTQAETSKGKPSLPKALPDQVAAIRALLAGQAHPIAAADLARHFRQGKRAEPKVRELLRTLSVLGQADEVDGRYVLNA